MTRRGQRSDRSIVDEIAGRYGEELEDFTEGAGADEDTQAEKGNAK
jgi:hypothetical protein